MAEKVLSGLILGKLVPPLPPRQAMITGSNGRGPPQPLALPKLEIFPVTVKEGLVPDRVASKDGLRVCFSVVGVEISGRGSGWVGKGSG